METVAIVGGGVAGVLSAKLLAAHGFQVTLFEGNRQLMTGASGRNWFRFHLGPHYPMDHETASGVMEASMAGAAYLRDFLYEGVGPPEYYIHPNPEMQQKLPNGERLDEVKFRAALVKQRIRYAELLQAYPEAEGVFGGVGKFFTELSSAARNFVLGCCYGVSSAERLMELTRLNRSLVVDVRGNPLISIRTSAQVEDVRWSRQDGFKLDVRLPEGDRSFQFDQVVQAGWAKGLRLDLQLVNNLRRTRREEALTGEQYAGETLHRLKVVAMIKGAAVDKDVTHKMIMSPQAAQYGYVGPGVGIASANHIQVIGSATGMYPAEWDKALSGEDGRVHEIAKAIFKYCRPFFPFLKDAEVVQGFAAAVVSGLDTGKRSAETLRQTGADKYGVVGYHSVSGMKLSNIPLAAVTVLRAVMTATGRDFGVDMSAPAEHTLRQFSQNTNLRIKPAPLSAIEQMVAGAGPLEAFRWSTTK